MLLRNGKIIVHSNNLYNLKLIKKDNPWWYKYTKEACCENKKIVDEKNPYLFLFNLYTIEEMIEFYLPIFGIMDPKEKYKLNVSH